MQLRSILGMLLQSSEPWRNQMKYPQPSATKRRFNTSVWKHLARQRPASGIYMAVNVIYILCFYYILIPNLLPNAEVFVCLPKIYWKSVPPMFSSPFLPTGSKMGGAETGVLCPGVHEGSWPPAPLGALTEYESSGAGSTSSGEFNMVLIHQLCIRLILVLHTGLNYTLNYWILSNSVGL